MAKVEGLNHIALAVPELDNLVACLVETLGMVVQRRSEHSAHVADPASGFTLELTETPGKPAEFRHLGFTTADVDVAYAELTEAGMASVEGPHRVGGGRIHTAFLEAAGGVQVQIVKYG